MVFKYHGDVYDKKDWMKLASAIRIYEGIEWNDAQEEAKRLLGCGDYNNISKKMQKGGVKIFSRGEKWDGLNVVNVTNKMVPKIQVTEFSETAGKRWSPYIYNNFEDMSAGNADWMYTSPSLIYVADGTGHMWILEYGEAGAAKLQRFNNALMELETNYEKNPSLANFNMLINELHGKMETTVGTAASFLSAIPVIYKKKHWLAITNIGDASGYLMIGNDIIKLENPNEAATKIRKGTELGSTIQNKEQFLIELPKNSSATVVLMTDGCYETMIKQRDLHYSKTTPNDIIKGTDTWKSWMNSDMTNQNRYALLRESFQNITSLQDYVQSIYAKSRAGALAIYGKIGIQGPPHELQKVFDDASVVAGIYDTKGSKGLAWGFV